jgi:anti-sigma-K factor RskA
MNEHPLDSIPAFVLSALDADEAIQVGAHLAVCPDCRDEAAAFQAAIGELPYAAEPQEPPAHIKHQLLARIAAASPTPPARYQAPRWQNVAAASALALALLLAFMFVDARRRLDSLAGQLNQSQLVLNQLRDENERHRWVAMFIADPRTQAQRLVGNDPAVEAIMYMQPGNRPAVLVVQHLRPAEQGKTYQCWLASGERQVPSGTFAVDPTGAAMLTIDAPAPLNQYEHVMITVEQAGGGTTPSNQVVLISTL